MAKRGGKRRQAAGRREQAAAAGRRTVGTIYSHSRLSSFEKCPRQFHYRYIERRPVDTESVEAFLGKRVHEVLERLYRFVERGLVPSLPKVLHRFRALWEERFDAARVRIVRQQTAPDSYREMGERCLANHYRRRYPFDGDESLGIEQHVSFALDAGRRYRMQGVIDRVVRAADGALEIHDYKTGRWVPSQQALDEDRQLALYQIGLAASGGDGRDVAAPPVRLVWHYLLRDQVRVSTRTAAQLDTLRCRTMELIDRVESERDFEPRPSALCEWCEFRDICPAAPAARNESTAVAAGGRPAERVAPAPGRPAAPRSMPAAIERRRPPARPARAPDARGTQLALFGRI
jgi:putative RecB family exonuclease